MAHRLSGDLRFASGRILGSMCSEPDPFSARVFTEQLEKNLGDPGLHPSLAEMESQTVSIIGSMLNGESASGALVSGGTEANILAMWTAKLKAGRGRRAVVLPEAAHFSFDKAASLMDLELRKLPVDYAHRISLSAFEKALDGDVMAAVGIAGTTGLGMVDPIPEMAGIAAARGIYFHVDAAFGGFVLPFLEEAGYESRPFDFSIPGVSSITIDPHKMGRAPIPAGCILYRNEEIAGISRTDVGYLSGGKTSHQTIVGTRPGAAGAAVWAALRRFGREGYVRTVESCMEVTMYLADRIASCKSVELVAEPFMNVVGFRPAGGADAAGLSEALRERGYAVSLFPGYIRITVMPHVTRAAADRLLEEIEDVHS
jgi:tyrosine decarboxylase/aspartate 1-decarboxylase